MDKEIRDAVECCKTLIHKLRDRGIFVEEPLKMLISLAERYLEVGMPEERHGVGHQVYDEGYNAGLSDYRLWLAKKLDALSEIELLEILTDEEEKIKGQKNFGLARNQVFAIMDLFRKHLGGENEI